MKKLFVGGMVLVLTASALADNCTLAREEVSGANKFCYYNCVAGQRVITVSAFSQCPLMQTFMSPEHSSLLVAISSMSTEQGAAQILPVAAAR